ncbi:hypothetical protein GXW82_15435 [Streptacidiphilus sp. 4-A2]|nr:hypothetical protein [Streptacidiphilus sp. 4-A2]
MISPDSAPRLRPDVFLVPSGRGTAYVRSSRGTDLIAAPGIALWLDRITPFLDGTHTVGQLLGGLDDTRRALVLGVLERLDAHDLLEDLADPGPARRASAYPRLRVLVLGAPPEGNALAGALRLTDTGPVTVTADPAEARAAASGGACDALLLLAPRADPHQIARLDQHCRRSGTWFAAAVGGSDGWWIGPVLRPGPGRAPGGWLGAWLRLHGSEPAPGHSGGAGAGAGGDVTGESTEVAAALLAHHFQRVFASPEPAPASAPGADELIRLDPLTLTTGTHRYQPHPTALAAAPEREAGFLAKLEALRGGPVIGAEEFSRRAAGCIDPRAGLIAALDEEALPQFPRRAAVAQVRDPATAGALHRVHGTGPDFTAARVRTARRALEVYSLLAADPRRFTATPTGPAVWAFSPEDGTARLVPATAVYGRGPRPPRGLGSGTTFAEAVDAARGDLRAGSRRRSTLVVPLDHDPAATRVLPYLLKAVDTHD